jgi:hypothetical protein
MNLRLEGAIGGNLLALVLMPIVYISMRGRDEHGGDHLQRSAFSGEGIDLERPREVEPEGRDQPPLAKHENGLYVG